jgi:para-nitrobenzyl esterase
VLRGFLFRPEPSLTLFFDTKLARVEVEGQERFRRVKMMDDTLTLVASEALHDRERVPVRGCTKAKANVVLVCGRSAGAKTDPQDGRPTTQPGNAVACFTQAALTSVAYRMLGSRWRVGRVAEGRNHVHSEAVPPVFAQQRRDVDHPLQRRPEQPLLRAEVAADERGIHPGEVRHLSHAGVGETSRREQGLRGVEDRGARALGIALARRSLGLGGAGPVHGGLPTTATGEGPVIADTASGQVRGVLSEGIRVFKGIPYGGPTSGKNRFMPPVKPEPWSGVRDAVEYVWTPDVGAGGKRPVMVWLHGGGFVEGSGSAALYDGTSLARRGDVVVVTLNHRLGALGYLYTGTGAHAPSGNAGMLDIVAALEWVRDNIASFGGDPGNVTIFGESGGGMKVTLVLAMPAAKGLFHKAISQSGALVRALQPEQATAHAGELMAELKLAAGDLEALQNLPVDKLLDAQTVVLKKERGAFTFNSPFTPVADGQVLPGNPFDPSAPAVSAGVPLMIGTNQDEMTLFLHGKLGVMTDGLPRMGLGRLAGDAKDRVFDHYRRAMPDAPARDVIIMAGSDLFRASSLLVAERKVAQAAAPVYVYLFTWETPVLDGKLKATHALEIPFVFDNADLVPSLTGKDPERFKLSEQMSSAWIAFARTGNPNHAGIPAWPAYTTEQRPTLLFNLTSRVENDPGREERLLWHGILTK